MAEYIEREAFFRFLTEQKDKETGAYSKGRNAGLDVARSALRNREITPAADVVEVVRCSKCIFGCYYEESESRHCRSINGLYRDVKDNDFCSYGERKENTNV